MAFYHIINKVFGDLKMENNSSLLNTFLHLCYTDLHGSFEVLRNCFKFKTKDSTFSVS